MTRMIQSLRDVLLNGNLGRASRLGSEEGEKALIWGLEGDVWMLIFISEVGGVSFPDLCEHRERGSGSLSSLREH